MAITKRSTKGAPLTQDELDANFTDLEDQISAAQAGDLESANNLSDVASASTSRANLGLEINTDVQAHSAVLDATTASFTTADETKLDAITGTNTGDEAAASDTVAGIVELATIAEVDTGTDTGRTITPAGLAGSALQTKVDGIEALADVTDATNVEAANAVMDSDFSGSQTGRLRRTGAGTYEAVKDNLVATAAPDETNDTTEGYSVGSEWIDVTNDNAYVCLDISTGAAVWKRISNPTIDTDTTIDVMASGGDYTNVSDALDSLDGVEISSSATVTILLEDGTFNVASEKYITHPNSDRIHIMGTNTHDLTMSSVASSSGSAGAWSVVCNVADSTNAAIGDFVRFASPSGGTNTDDMAGCFEITAVPSGTQITLTVPSKTATAPSGAITGTINVLKTVLQATEHFFGIFRIEHGRKLGQIGKMAIVGNGAGANAAVRLESNGSHVTFENNTVGIANANTGLWTNSGSTAKGTGLCVSGCATGISVSNGTSVQCNTSRVSGCTTGFSVLEGAVFKSGAAIRVSGCTTGIYSQLGKFHCGTGAKVSNCTTGAYALYGGYISIASTTFSGNTTDASPAINTVGNDESYIKS